MRRARFRPTRKSLLRAHVRQVRHMRSSAASNICGGSGFDQLGIELEGDRVRGDSVAFDPEA